MLRTVRFFILLIVLGVSDAYAQFDYSFTQYMFNEMFINPAYAGSHEALSMNTLHRYQWVGIEGAPRNRTFTVHTPVFNHRIGLGAAIMNESIGISNRTTVNFNGAYRIHFAKSALAFGLKAGFVSIGDRWNEIQTVSGFDDQYAAVTTRFTAPNFGFGSYYNTEKWYVGFSIPRMIENKIDASALKVKNDFNLREYHYYLTGGYVHTFNSQLKMKPMLMLKAVPGAPLQSDITLNFLIREKVWAGAGYRTGDAIYVMTGLYVTPQLLFSYSFDYTTTSLRKYNNGSHELQLSYIFKYKNKEIVSPRLF